jgi:hypothetical protein
MLPAHGLCMAYPKYAFARCIELEGDALQAYFLGNTSKYRKTCRDTVRFARKATR